MSQMKTGSIAKVGGYVKRSWCNAAGTFATVSVDAPDSDDPGSRAPVIECKCFAKSGGPVEEIKNLKAGQKVMLTCKLSSECLKDKAGNEIKKDGYSVWHTVVIVTKVEIEASSIRQEQKKEEKPSTQAQAGFSDDKEW